MLWVWCRRAAWLLGPVILLGISIPSGICLCLLWYGPCRLITGQLVGLVLHIWLLVATCTTSTAVPLGGLVIGHSKLLVAVCTTTVGLRVQRTEISWLVMISIGV